MQTINRRGFLAGTAALSAFTVLKPQTVFGSMLNSAIRVGIIGCGGRGTEVLGEMIRNTGAQVIAMADLFDYRLEKAKPVFDRLNTEKGGVTISKSKVYKGSKAFLKLIEDPDVDAVLVSTPAYAHPEITEAAVLQGKHVYCEKPVSPDVAGCRKMMRTGEIAQGKVSLAVGFQIRLASPYKEMARRIWQGDIGEVISVQLYYLSSRGNMKNPEGKSREEFLITNHFHFTEMSGGILLDQGIHLLDVCNWVLNAKPEVAVGSGNRKGRTDAGDAFTNFQVIYGYPGEVNVSIHSVQSGPAFGDVCVRFIGTKGFAEAHYTGGVFISGENNWDSGVLRGQKPTPEQAAAGVFSSSLQDSTPNKVKAFIRSIETGELINEARQGATSTLTAILGNMAALRREETTWDEVYYSNQQYERKLNLEQFD